LLKAPHHGSRDGLTPLWLNATKPQVVVVSCGVDNPYGHPNRWALRYYSNVADHIYRTDVHGDVLVLGAKDGTYTVSTGKAAIGMEGIGGLTLLQSAWRAVAAYAN